MARLIWAIGLLLTIATPLTFAASGSSVLPGDVAITNAVHQSLPGWTAGFVTFANLLGLAPVALGVAIALTGLLSMRRWYADAALVASAGLAWGGNALLKSLAESPRPTASLVRISENADGFGFPSGHVMGVTVLCGAIFLVATRRIASVPLRRLVQSVAIATPLVTGIARIEVGAHWPSDVLGGYLWGMILLLGVVLMQVSWQFVGNVCSSIASRVPLPRRQVSLAD